MICLPVAKRLTDEINMFMVAILMTLRVAAQGRKGYLPVSYFTFQCTWRGLALVSESL